MDHLYEKTLDSQVIYDGRIMRIRRDRILLPNGKESIREVMDHPGGVCVLPLDEEGNVLFVRQFRYPYSTTLLELPAGKLERGEEPAVCGMRELEEETGYRTEELIPLGKMYPTPGCMNEVLHLYLAEHLTRGEKHPDEDEFLDLVRIPLERAMEMVLSGELPDAKTQLSLLLYEKRR